MSKEHFDYQLQSYWVNKVLP